MVQPLNYLRESPSQTAGPYVHIGLAPGAAAKVACEQAVLEALGNRAVVARAGLMSTPVERARP